MTNDIRDLPPELQKEFLSFLREENGNFEVADFDGLLAFVAKHSEKYPALLDLFTFNEEAAIKHFKETGAVPPGVKIIHKETEEGSNVTKVEVFRGPLPPKS